MGLFTNRRERELRREAKIRQARGRVQNYLKRSRTIERHYWGLSKRALGLGDRERFRQLAIAMIRARDSRNRWDRYLLELDTLSIRRDEVIASNSFLESINAVTASIMEGAGPKDVTAVQAKLSEAMTRAQSLNESLSEAMEEGAEAMFNSDGIDDTRLDQVINSMRDHGQMPSNTPEESDCLEEALARIEHGMLKETAAVEV